MRRGFTFIELLVVLAIVALVVSLAIVIIQNARAKSRDVSRERHVKTLQNALEIYVANTRLYPVASGGVYLSGDDPTSLSLKSADALPQTPQDPLNSGMYRYFYISEDGSSYKIQYYLETDEIPGKSKGLNEVSP